MCRPRVHLGASGKPLTKESFGNAFKEACVAAGVDEAKKAAHGIRKVGATRATDNGATEKQIGAGLIVGAELIPFAHLETLLRLGYVCAASETYEATASGVFRIAGGS